MRKPLRALCCVALAAAILVTGTVGCQKTPPPTEAVAKNTTAKAPPTHRFDEQDPEIQALKNLDAQGVDMAKVDTKTEVAALLLLNSMLLEVGQKAKGRVGLLQDYIKANKLEKALATDDDPVADVIYGVDNTFLCRALIADIFVPYEAVGLDAVPSEFQLDDRYRVTPIDFGDVCINYWGQAYEAQAPPEVLEDLTEEAYNRALVVQNPETS